MPTLEDFWPTRAAVSSTSWRDSDYFISAKEYVEEAVNFVKSDRFMRGVVIGTGVVLAAGSVAASYLWTSVPDGMYPEDRWAVRRIYARNQWAGLLAKIGVKLGLGKPWDLHRRFRDPPIVKPKRTNTNIFVEHLQFDGVSVVLYRKNLYNLRASSNDLADSRPAIVHIYGGGWCFSTSETYEAHHRLLTEKLNAAILTIDYRKSPEHPFPAGFNDCYNAIRYFYEHAEEFGVDPARISILADSAGGNIAAGVTLKIRDEALGLTLKSQLLIYPCTQFMNFRTNSYLSTVPLLQAEQMAMFAALYAGEKPPKIAAGMLQNYHFSKDFQENPGWQALKRYAHHVTIFEAIATDYLAFQRKALNPYMCPLMAANLKGLPPTLVMICQFDVLKDDALAFMDRLQFDGVPVGLKVYPGPHGTFRSFEELKVGREMMHDVIEYFRGHM
ncbi:putative Arylacetamide deacetylase [Hypsibius exemplaris]|uniref:Arylacetamide deacetylase n=1 Tax=Hypsibius exemplaris TaxID=2072580 RepID=A0A1W0WP22_HYPEX|nr:putative Arylacetamide deacetylase [Hypsibius exemplaris]